MHMPERLVDAGVLQENEKHKNKDVRASTSTRAPSTDIPPKKFLKSKSRIFKFWV
jgi:hypothetical protein